ncbi:hypothetical protein [Streptomyces sp. VRA16 Mangrove soil]|uniref:hypothetical protein n=1 Tax=Streptomyces sp. VRA16 Mangrove soil TaxID=2817434 RepID=UPI001A9D84FD|nr:hypothetical protein [Streptomyces sp. VRA16 Mangrove soil]MBO1330679.1 hypothetical protein [Streptomyces sp. VRA16 Mangrove soil]
MSAKAVALFGRITRGDRPGAGDAEALAELRAWRMVGETGPGGQVTPLPPTEAAWNVGRDALAHLQQQIVQLAQLPGVLEQLNVQFAQSRQRAGAGSEFLADRAEVNERIGVILAGAQEELLGAHPHQPRTREQMRVGIPRDATAIERGVRYRTLYQDIVRDDAVSCEWASVMSERGAQYRTLADPFERVVIVDRKVAVISDYVIPDAPEHAAWIITDRAMVGFAVHAFEQEWRRAKPWHGERRSARAGSGILTDVQRAILRCFSEGATQEGVARGLGMSTRSLQRQLDQVRALWALPNASVAQLTFHWALSPERDVPAGQVV